MSMEKQVKIATTLYEARDTMRRFWGDRYPAKIAENQSLIKKAMVRLEMDELRATIKVMKALQDFGDDTGLTQAMILAAYV